MGIARRVTAAATLLVVATACGGSSTTAAPPTSASTTAAPTTTTVDAIAGRPYTVTTRHFDFVDRSRPAGKKGDAWYKTSRALPTDVYLPSAPGRRPLIMLAHGQSGSPAKFTKLLTVWARAGYVAAAPRFPVSSDTGPGMAGVIDWLQQPADMSFVLTQLLHSDLGAHIDARHIGISGLSLGGGTVYGLVDNPCCRDPRFTAAAVFDGERFPFSKRYETNRIPILIIHGDIDPVLPYSEARLSYRLSARPKWFVTLIGGLHSFAFEDTPSPHDRAVEQFTTDYWDLTLLGSEAAAARLLDDATVPGISRIVSAR